MADLESVHQRDEVRCGVTLLVLGRRGVHVTTDAVELQISIEARPLEAPYCFPRRDPIELGNELW